MPTRRRSRVRAAPSGPERFTMNRMVDLSVPAPNSGERLDRFLATAQTDLSRSRLQALIREGRVRVNGRPARASQRPRSGDRVHLELPDPGGPRTTALEPGAPALAVGVD